MNLISAKEANEQALKVARERLEYRIKRLPHLLEEILPTVISTAVHNGVFSASIMFTIDQEKVLLKFLEEDPQITDKIVTDLEALGYKVDFVYTPDSPVKYPGKLTSILITF